MHSGGHVRIWLHADKESFVFLFPHCWDLLTGLLHPGVMKAGAGSWLRAEPLSAALLIFVPCWPSGASLWTREEGQVAGCDAALG